MLTLRDMIRPLCVSIFMGFFLFFISCASQEGASTSGLDGLTEEQLLDDEEFAAEEGAALGEMGDDFNIDFEEEDTGDLGASLDEAQSDGEIAADTTLDDLEGDLGLPSEEEMAGQIEGNVQDAELLELEGEKLAGSEASYTEDELGDVLGLPVDGEADVSQTVQEPELTVAEATNSNPDIFDEYSTDSQNSVSDLPPVEDVQPTYTPTAPARKAWSGVSKIPSVPMNAVEKSGVSLNRFYFVRAGDTPSSVSNLFYGDSSHAADLQEWNAGSWNPGDMIYYRSAKEADDMTMRSFYKENDVVAQTYTVRGGDWLSTIAGDQLGSTRSWKEIAVINGLKSADNISAGQALAIYPTDLSSYSTKLVVNEPPPEQVTPPPAVVQSPPVVQAAPPVQLSPPPPVAVNNQAKQNFYQKRARKTEQGFNISKFLKNESFTLAMGMLIAGLLGALFILNRRKKGQRKKQDDFDDDIFSRPSKRK